MEVKEDPDLLLLFQTCRLNLCVSILLRKSPETTPTLVQLSSHVYGQALKRAKKSKKRSVREVSEDTVKE